MPSSRVWLGRVRCRAPGLWGREAVHAGPMQGQPPARRLWPSGQRQYELCGLCWETQPGPRGSAQPGSKAVAQGLVPVRLSWQHGPVTAPTLCFTPSLSGWDNTLCLCRFPDMGEGTPGVSSPLGPGPTLDLQEGVLNVWPEGRRGLGTAPGVLPALPHALCCLSFPGRGGWNRNRGVSLSPGHIRKWLHLACGF